MTPCEVCGAQTQLYLCKTHTTELANMLTGLPSWILHLQESAVGQTRLGSNSDTRRTPGDQAPMRFNDHARRLGAEITQELVAWCQRLGNHTGVTFSPLEPTEGPLRAMWLADHTPTLAGIDQIGQLHARLHDFIDRAEHILDRPTPARFCGPCPTITQQYPRKLCSTELHTHNNTTEVTCPKCRNTYKVQWLLDELMRDLERQKFTIQQIHDLMRMLPETERIPERTLRHWRQHHHLKPCGYRRGGPEGPHVITRHSDDDIPTYRWIDIRRLRAGQTAEGKPA